MEYSEFENEVQASIALVRELNLTTDGLLRLAAGLMVTEKMQENTIESLSKQLEEAALAMHVFSNKIKENVDGLDLGLLEMMTEMGNATAKALIDGAALQKKAAGKHAVRFREDQLLKPLWENHVKKCVERGVTVKNIGDLLNESGYDPRLANVSPATLKKWAKEAVPSLEFKPGRPK